MLRGSLVLTVLAIASQLSSESVTLTTYYPAPSGVYTKMITTADTYLSRDGGTVSIGSAATNALKLRVTGSTTFDGAAAINGATAINGALRIAGGSPGSNRILVADAAGNATLQNSLGLVNCVYVNADWSGVHICPAATPVMQGHTRYDGGGNRSYTVGIYCCALR